MREHEMSLLRASGPCSDARSASRQMHEALGVLSTPTEDLASAIVSDLSTTDHGIAWWACPDADVPRRILVSDHLVAAVTSIGTNLAEAALHQWEHRAAWEAVDRRYSRVRQPDGTVRFPGYSSCADLVPDVTTTMHLAGYFRAIGSAMDCLAASMIGVCAVPSDILGADLGKLLSWLRGERNKADTRLPLHCELLRQIEQAERDAGPDGWFPWVRDYRNMIVHRGRRTEIRTMAVAAHVVDASGTPVPRSTAIPLLLRDPGVSNVAAVRGLRDKPFTLSENADVTLTEVLRSTVYLIRSTSEFLVSTWQDRKGASSPHAQPLDRQWPRVEEGAESIFEGYAPNTVPVNFDGLITSQLDHQRVNSSGIRTDVVEKVWKR